MKSRIALIQEAVETQKRMIEAVKKSAAELEREREEARAKTAREALLRGR